MNQELIDYIKKSREAGQSDEQIKQALLATGWQVSDLKESFDVSHKNNSTESVKRRMLERIRGWANYKKAIIIILINAAISAVLLGIFSSAIFFLGMAMGPIFGYKEALAVFVFAPYAFIIINLLFFVLISYLTRRIFERLLFYRINYFLLFISSVIIVLLFNFGATGFKKISYQKDLKEDILDTGSIQQRLDDKEVAQLTKNDAPQRNPKISGNKIIWEEPSGATNGMSLVLFDSETNKKIKIDDLGNPSRKNSSGRMIIGYAGEAIFGNDVYWVKDNKLMEYNSISGKSRTILDEISYVYDVNSRYIIGDKGVKFSDGSSITTGNPFIHDIKTEKEIALAEKLPEASFGVLKLSGDKISFITILPNASYEHPNGRLYSLYVYDIMTDKLSKLIDSEYINHDFNGNKIIFTDGWEDPRLRFFSDASSKESLLDLNLVVSTDVPPIISGDIIAYSRVEDNRVKIFLYDLIIKQEKVVDSFSCIDPKWPNIGCSRIRMQLDIDDNLLVWSDERNVQNHNGNSDVFLYKIK